MLDELVAEQDPWGFLETIQRREVPQNQRHRLYSQFIALVAQRPEAERDALIEQGRAVFHYRTETARRDAQELRSTGAGVTKISPVVIGEDFIAEIIHQPGHPQPIRYMIYHDATGEIEIQDRVQVGEIMYVPPQTRLVDTGTLLLPTGVEEYGDEPGLFASIWHFIQSHVHFENESFKSLAAYYVLLTWIYDRFDVVPYLRAQGDWGTGKTRMLQVIGHLAYRPIFAGGATTAAPIFRIIDRFPGTLVIDEADFGKSDLWDDIVKILNVGYQRGFPVLRAERGGRNDNFDVQSYDCYSPKLLSTRKRFNDPALESRCLSHTMYATTVPRHIPLFLNAAFRQRASQLRNKLLLWRFRTYRAVNPDPRMRFDGFDARLNQIMIPLISCVDDEGMRHELLEHAKEYQAMLHEDTRDSWVGRVAQALLKRYRNARQKTPGVVLLKEVTDQLKQDHEEMKVEPRSVGQTMRHTFGLKTKEVGGYTWVEIKDPDAQRLAQRYRIPFESFTRPSVSAVAFNPPRVQPPRQPATVTQARRQPVRALPEAPGGRLALPGEGETS